MAPSCLKSLQSYFSAILTLAEIIDTAVANTTRQHMSEKFGFEGLKVVLSCLLTAVCLLFLEIFTLQS